jgi:hypothetical protein
MARCFSIDADLDPDIGMSHQLIRFQRRYVEATRSKYVNCAKAEMKFTLNGPSRGSTVSITAERRTVFDFSHRCSFRPF